MHYWKDLEAAMCAAQNPRPYAYAGPADVLAAITPGERGRLIASVDDLTAWLAALAQADRSGPQTFVVDEAGDLRVGAQA
ncbi:hypothetical protein [Hamadaea tsunoensis]|uniref:hypothetical protein n=1 Tax=Hamadaea tsunoensis TaxID=53368 RepID=UPI000400D148|nr:hypothetical protein [Hamadaea tsunoensis]